MKSMLNRTLIALEFYEVLDSLKNNPEAEKEIIEFLKLCKYKIYIDDIKKVVIIFPKDQEQDAIYSKDVLIEIINNKPQDGSN